MKPKFQPFPDRNLVIRIANLLNKPERFNEWVELAMEIDTFGDYLPVDWQRCYSPRFMLQVLEYTRLCREMTLTRPLSTRYTLETSVKNLYEKTSVKDPYDSGIWSAATVVQVALVDGRFARFELGAVDAAPTADAIRALVPVVRWTDLQA